MSSLADIIAKKKRALAPTGSTPAKKKYKTRREVEEEKEAAEEAIYRQQNPTIEPVKSSENEESKEEQTQEIKTAQYDREEVIKRLRQAGQVVTFFGETDREREQRWVKYDSQSKEDFSYNKGTKNDFDDMLRNLDTQQNGDEDEEALKRQKEELSNQEFLQTPIEEIFIGLHLCPEDQVLLMFRRLLEEWKVDCKRREEELLKTVHGRKHIVTVKQSESFLRPLFKSLKQRTLSKDILSCLLEVVDAIVRRNYTQAGNFYIQMAVGNAPWPIGVTMVGIHARSAREKISSNQVAHVLNDETQRKYIQSVYRLIKFCQEQYPAAPSKSIG